MPQEFKPWLGMKMFDIALTTSEQIIDANDFKAIGNEVYYCMRTDVAASAGDKDLLHSYFLSD